MARFRPRNEGAKGVFQDTLDFANNYVNCSVCHAFKKQYFLELLHSQMNTFVQCTKWPDVNEGFGYSLPLQENASSPKNISIEHWKDDVFGQCWSLNKPSQYMLDEYNGATIIVTSTIGDLFSDFYDFAKTRAIENGIKANRITYCEPQDMPQKWCSLQKQATNDEINQAVMEYFLQKQIKYSHENEIRFLIDMTLVQQNQWKVLGIWKYDVDLNRMIRQVVLPSNLSSTAFSELKEAMIAVGLGNKLVVSEN